MLTSSFFYIFLLEKWTKVPIFAVLYPTRASSDEELRKGHYIMGSVIDACRRLSETWEISNCRSKAKLEVNATGMLYLIEWCAWNIFPVYTYLGLHKHITWAYTLSVQLQRFSQNLRGGQLKMEACVFLFCSIT